ncbi:hypothetical protein GPECTOR_6g523 [Gonium pectorale]|uniref:Glutamine amidotransferase domain-containing protein n=1 Tax=Gonium pectorale TaxID=33097 RepID=A0A150GUQ7_GONPE|nr:hypothetical protein GPECTOR_6g523 [Gonium pectorale]|eukprot:KXZ53606.1 hypothetical protein GPECTOR_6g523 [Gonium pectorale]
MGAIRAAILCCEDAEKWTGWTERVWRGLLEEPGDAFSVFRCHAGEFPDPQTVRHQFDVLVVGGSHYSAYDEVEWIRRLESLLPQYVASGVRLVGCCFGHQLLAQALGGRVGPNPSGRFVLGVETVAVDADAAAACGLELPPCHLPTLASGPGSGSGVRAQATAEAETGVGSAGREDPGAGGAPAQAEPSPLGAARGTGGREEAAEAGPAEAGPGPAPAGGCVQLRLLQSHGDQVLQLPPGAALLATSGGDPGGPSRGGGTAAHEMWSLPGRVVAFQFHPELTSDLVYDKIWTALSTSGRLSAEEAAAAEAQLKRGPAGLDVDVFVQALRGFVRGTSVPGSQAATGPAAAAAATAAEAAAADGVAAAAALRQALEAEAGAAAAEVAAHVRQAATAGTAGRVGLAAGTSSAQLLTALNGAAAAAYGTAADAAEAAAEQLLGRVAAQAEPLQAALASLGALEAQLDRLAAVVGQLEVQSEQAEAEVQAMVGAGAGPGPGPGSAR